MYALLGIAFVTLVIANPLSSSSVETRSVQEIYQSALRENRTLRVSWGGDVRTSGDMVSRAFEKSFPGIKIEVLCDLSKYLDGRINRIYETSNGKDDGADVAVIQSLHNFPRWKSENRLLNYKPANWDDIYPEFVDKDGAYAGYYIFTFGPTVYNPLVYQKSDLPQFYPDYLDERWSNQIILPYPNDDDAVLYLFTLIVGKYGWKFIDTLKTQNVKWVRGTATPSLYIAEHNSTSGSPSSRAHSISFASSTAFAKGVVSTLNSDTYMAWPQTGAIFSSTPAPETAKLFMNFLLSDERQAIVGDDGFATRRKFDTGGVFKQKNVEPLGYGTFMSDRPLVESWRLEFENALGTPQGPDPLELISI